jgi:hypothetical protein
MKQLTIEKVHVGSLAKVVGVTEAVFAFVVGLVTSLAVAAGSITASTTFVHTLGLSVTALGMGVVLFPAVAFVVGWVQGVAAAVVLNFVLKETRGVSLEVEEGSVARR